MKIKPILFVGILSTIFTVMFSLNQRQGENGFRSIASESIATSCIDMISRLAKLNTDFNQDLFVERFRDLGAGAILNHIERNSDMYDEPQVLIDTIRKQEDLSDLSQRQIWNNYLYKKSKEFENYELEVLARSNHPLAKILLNSASQNEIENLKSIVISLKTLNPSFSDNQIADEILKRLTTCRVR